MEYMLDDSVVTSAGCRSQPRARSLNADEMSSRIDFSLVLHERSNERCIEYIAKDKTCSRGVRKRDCEGVSRVQK
jgi:hypothetical protein